jgi:hypothetical protein
MKRTVVKKAYKTRSTAWKKAKSMPELPGGFWQAEEGGTPREVMTRVPAVSYMHGKRNPGTGKAFTFHGSFQSLILARRKEREIPGSFIHKSGDRYYVLKPKKISTPRKNPKVKTAKQNPRHGVLIYGKVLKIYAEKTAGPFKGQRFVHKFKAGAIMMGMPDGSLRIMHPK